MPSAVVLFASLALLRLVPLSQLVLVLVVSPIALCFVVVATIVGVGIYVVRYIAHHLDCTGVARVLTRGIDVCHCCHPYCCFVGCSAYVVLVRRVASVC